MLQLLSIYNKIENSNFINFEIIANTMLKTFYRCTPYIKTKQKCIFVFILEATYYCKHQNQHASANFSFHTKLCSYESHFFALLIINICMYIYTIIYIHKKAKQNFVLFRFLCKYIVVNKLHVFVFFLSFYQTIYKESAVEHFRTFLCVTSKKTLYFIDERNPNSYKQEEKWSLA